MLDLPREVQAELMVRGMASSSTDGSLEDLRHRETSRLVPWRVVGLFLLGVLALGVIYLTLR